MIDNMTPTSTHAYNSFKVLIITDMLMIEIFVSFPPPSNVPHTPVADPGFWDGGGGGGGQVRCYSRLWGGN